MAITLKNLITGSVTLPTSPLQTTLCLLCPEPITEYHFRTEEVRKMKDGFAHADCYYDSLGEEIEKSPIFNPTLRR